MKEISDIPNININELLQSIVDKKIDIFIQYNSRANYIILPVKLYHYIRNELSTNLTIQEGVNKLLNLEILVVEDIDEIKVGILI